MDQQITTQQPFLNRLDLELKRAERYRIFISLLVFDFSSVGKSENENSKMISKDLINQIAGTVRSIDTISTLDENKVALMFPETNRQGAEIVSKRISELINNHISEKSKTKIDYKITPEMASFPDAAGTKSINDFISEYSSSNIN